MISQQRIVFNKGLIYNISFRPKDISHDSDIFI